MRHPASCIICRRSDAFIEDLLNSDCRLLFTARVLFLLGTGPGTVALALAAHRIGSADAEGGEHTSRLWIVDVEGSAYLRNGTGTTAWLGRLRANPRAKLTRDDVARPVTATVVDDARIRELVNAAVAA